MKQRLKKIFLSTRIHKRRQENALVYEKIDLLAKKIDYLQQSLDNCLRTVDNLAREQRTFLSLENLKVNSGSKVLIMGFYGGRNLGDELMLKTILDYLNEKKVKATIMLADNYDLDSSIYYPYDVIHYPSKSSDFSAIADRFDTVIWGGGAVLDDENYKFNGAATPLAYILFSVSKAMIKKGGNVIVLGVSSNDTFHDRAFVDDLKYIVRNSNYFSLRDSYSLKVLENVGINVSKIKIIDDLALKELLPVSRSKASAKPMTIGVVYIMTEDTLPMVGRYTQKLVQLSKEMEGKRLSVIIKLIPFYDYKENDEKMYKKMVADFINNDDGNIIINSFPESMDELEEIFLDCDCVVAMRYHAALIASCMGIQTVVVDYSGEHRHYKNKMKYIKDKYDHELKFFKFGDSENEFYDVISGIINGRVVFRDTNSLIHTINNELTSELDVALKNVI